MVIRVRSKSHNEHALPSSGHHLLQILNKAEKQRPTNEGTGWDRGFVGPAKV